MFCPNCGKSNAEDARFCSDCGKQLELGTGVQNEINSFQNFNQKHRDEAVNKPNVGIQPPITQSFDYENPRYGSYDAGRTGAKSNTSGGLGILVGLICFALIGTWWLDFVSVEFILSKSVTMQYVVEQNNIEWATPLFCITSVLVGCITMVYAFDGNAKGVYSLPLTYAAVVGMWYIYAYGKMLNRARDYIDVVPESGFILGLIGCAVIIICSIIAMSSNRVE